MTQSFITEAEARGEARGRAEGEVRSILAFLRARFDLVPPAVRDKLSTITDLEHLERLAAKVATVQTLDEFADALE